MTWTLKGDDVRATALLNESLALWRELGHQGEIAWTLFHLGRVAIFQSDYAQATARLTEVWPYSTRGTTSRASPGHSRS